MPKQRGPADATIIKQINLPLACSVVVGLRSRTYCGAAAFPSPP